MPTWEETTYESEIYVEMLYFRKVASRLERQEALNLIYENIDKNIKKKNIRRAILYLNEMELLYGIENTRYAEYEYILSPLYHDMVKDYHLQSDLFIDTEVKHNFMNLHDFKNKHQGQRCFILGNGPSLNKVDLSKLKNEITFGVNSIFLNFKRMGFQVTYYAVEDSHVIRERSVQIGLLDKPVKFIPQLAVDKIPFSMNNVYMNVIMDYSLYEGFPFFSTDCVRRLWPGGTVTYLNMQLAYYMGFEEVYLVGFDHNYVIPASAVVKAWDIQSTEDDPNHFHPDYFGKGYHWHIPLTERMELCYIKANYAFECDGRKMFNATRGGKLDVIERKDYDSLFQVLIQVPEKINPPYVNSYRNSIRTYDISIIIPVLDDNLEIIATLNSALSQFGIYVEVIAVYVDGNPSAQNICLAYAEKYRNFKLIYSLKNDWGAACNTGIANALGKYVLFLNDNDVLDRSFLYMLLAKMALNNIDVISFNCHGNGNKQTSPIINADLIQPTGIKAFLQLAKLGILTTRASIYRMDFLRRAKLNFEENQIYADMLFSLKAHYMSTYIELSFIQGINCKTSKFTKLLPVNENNVTSLHKLLQALNAWLNGEGIFAAYEAYYYLLCFKLFRIHILDKIKNDYDSDRRIPILRLTRKLMLDLGLFQPHIASMVKSLDHDLVESCLENIF